MEVDRIDNNGNYAPGNIRFVNRQTNCVNMRKTVLTRFEQKYWPYSYPTIVQKLSKGMTRDEIIAEAKYAIANHRLNWKKFAQKLEFMIYEMLEDIIVLPYRDT